MIIHSCFNVFVLYVGSFVVLKDAMSGRPLQLCRVPWSFEVFKLIRTGCLRASESLRFAMLSLPTPGTRKNESIPFYLPLAQDNPQRCAEPADSDMEVDERIMSTHMCVSHFKIMQ